MFKKLLCCLLLGITLSLSACAFINKHMFGHTPLMLAIGEGEIEGIIAELDAGADPNEPNESGKETPLTAVSTEAKGNVEIAQLLIERGADVNIKNSEGRTALMYAAERNHIDYMNLLLKEGAEVNVQDYQGMTALMYASESVRLNAVELLIKNKAQVGTKDSEGRTALMHVAIGSAGATIRDTFSVENTDYNRAVADVLIKNKAVVNDTDQYGNTPLMHAAANGELGVVYLLLDRKARVNEKNSAGNTAILCSALGTVPRGFIRVENLDASYKIIVAIRQAGGDHRIKNREGIDALTVYTARRDSSHQKTREYNAKQSDPKKRRELTKSYDPIISYLRSSRG